MVSTRRSGAASDSDTEGSLETVSRTTRQTRSGGGGGTPAGRKTTAQSQQHPDPIPEEPEEPVEAEARGSGTVPRQTSAATGSAPAAKTPAARTPAARTPATSRRGPKTPAAALPAPATPAPAAPVPAAPVPAAPVPAAPLPAAPSPAAPLPAAPASAAPAPARTAAAAASSSQQQHSDDEDDEDDDEDMDLLGGSSMEQLAASIRAALQARHFAGGSAAPVEEEAGSRDGSDSEDEEGGGGGEGGGVSGTNVAGPSAADGDTEARVLRWRPEVDPLKGSSRPMREVHRRGPISGEKEKGLCKKLTAPPRDPALISKAAKRAAPDTAGGNWYNMPAARIDGAMKTELRLLQLRGAYDPKRFYKSFDRTKFPKYFQMGTVVEGPTDFYGGRLTNAERKSTLTEQLLADKELTHARKKRNTKLQVVAQKWSGKKRKGGDAPRSDKNVKHTTRRA
ncbi:hypothetical protein FOA52_002413 [Chlamydomonas sp. UWO 241]|nr:hypothetical protein FOA52_002413 [Chlamydomonas sp. UWO 241]